MIHTHAFPAFSTRLLTLAAAALLHGAIAQGAIVLPNTSFNPGTTLGAPTTIAATGSLSGTVIADQTIAFASTPTVQTPIVFFTGTIRSLVVQRTDTSTFDFYYQLLNNTATEEFEGDANIFTFAVENFAGFGFPNNDALDLLVRSDGLAGLTGAGSFTIGTIAAITGFRDSMSPTSVGFTFATDPGAPLFDANNLTKGTTSSYLVIRSNATTFASSPTSISGTFGTALTQAYAPTPEPTVASLTAIGALGLGLLRRRTIR